ncbi:DUF6296 family protein [Kitasatospora purpeofusca]|uniref:DUF6296 family protein n=1 Tax=Kitasatospora purpeofusca TaxID=67352 RepID=UPI0004C01502|nr:DUF6296 family protein [Kitasatospora purpeofusca]
MDTPWCYAITLPGPPGCHAPPQVIVVHATGETTRNGETVYADAAGTLRVTITRGVAEPIDAPAGPGRHTCLHAHPLP